MIANGFPGIKPQLRVFKSPNEQACMFRAPDHLGVDFHQLVDRRIKSQVNDALATCAMHRAYMLMKNEHRTAIVVSRVPKPVWHGYKSGPWVKAFNSLEAL